VGFETFFGPVDVDLGTLGFQVLAEREGLGVDLLLESILFGQRLPSSWQPSFCQIVPPPLAAQDELLLIFFD